MSSNTQITLKTAVVLPFVMIFIITIGAILTIQKNSYEEVVVDISDKQLTALTNNVNQELHSFLDEPFQASLNISHNIGFNRLYTPDNVTRIEQYLLPLFRNLYGQFDQLDAMSFGGENAEFIGFRKEKDQDFSLMLQDTRTQGKLVIYRGSAISEDIRSEFEGYDPRPRPWYAPVAKSLAPMWSSIYTNVDEKQAITLSALAPVFYDGEFQGVAVNDINIDTFNAFLRQQQKKTNAIIYIVDQDKRIVAQSKEGRIVSWGTRQSKKGERLLATENANPIVRASANYFSLHNFHLKNQSQSYSFSIEGQRYFNHFTPYNDEHGLKWYIGVAISESDLLGKLPESQRDSWLIGAVASFIGICLGLLAFNHIVAPITSTADAAKRLAKGDWDTHMPKPGRIYETTMLVSAFSEMADNLKASFRALRSQLLYDSLTKLYSREGLVDTCDKLPELDGSLMLIGINKFRDINDSIGHHQGDKLLVIISQRLKSVFDGEYYLARIGGDEFAVYFPQQKSEQSAQQTAQRLLKAFASPFVIEHESIVVSVSIGIVVDGVNENMTLWLRNGSIALSNAKQDITNISVYRPEMADISRNRTLMQAKIKDALENHEFVPFYQPLVDLKTGEIIGAEALARWISPSDGLIPPMEFIPVAEESGLIGSIGEQILMQSCCDAVTGIKQGKWGSSFHMHVNLSVNQLSQPDFIPTLRKVLRQSTLSASNLTLEITESRIVDNDPVIIKNMQAIRDLGVHIAIDDFGTGYSSLAYLHKLPFNCLKIDRTFVNNLSPEQLDNSIVAAIVNMTKGMNISLVAEGIETKQQVELLSQLNCPLGQGFLYSKPVPFDNWPTKLDIVT